MSKHTAGPWIIVDEGFLGIEIHSANDRDLADAPAYYAIARDIGGRRHGDHFDDHSEVDANARLIAAAPDLLEALESLVLFTNPSKSNAAALNNALQAIAKATGE